MVIPNPLDVSFHLMVYKTDSLIITEKDGKIYLVKNDNSQFYNKTNIQSIREIEYTGYVYDLTTDNHHFAAGIGNMIVEFFSAAICVSVCKYLSCNAVDD